MRATLVFCLYLTLVACSSVSAPPAAVDRDTGVLDDSDTSGNPGSDTPDRSDVAFGEDCVGNAECASGYCVHAGAETGTCTVLCNGECSREGYSCQTLHSPQGNEVSVCYPDETRLCSPCSGHDECGDGNNLCLDGADGPHCALRCEEGDLCPRGYECQEQTVPGNDVLKVCALVDARCDECAGLDFANDPDNCGWCGNVCADDNGRASCAEGRCQVECLDGWADCNGDAGDGCETELANVCGTCAALEGDPGGACGTCGSGQWTCDGADAVLCLGDLGPDSYNSCGGCGELPAPLGDACGTCGSGRWACNGEDAVICEGDAGNVAINACGGCAQLGDGAPGDACGACGDGRLVCDGINALRCSDATPRNACGGCNALPNAVGDSCGPCGRDRYECTGQESVVCGGTTTNVCGGCAELDGAPGGACGACEDGVYVCESDNVLGCRGASEPEEVNACGGCRPLLREPGESCGACFNDVYVCEGRNGVRCQSGVRGEPRPGREIGGNLFADIDSDELRLTEADGPYVVTSGVHVPAGKTLTVEAGTLFKFVPQPGDAPALEFAVDGTLVSLGTLADPVVFTSGHDDCNGGDTNGDGVATEASPGDWGALRVNSAGSALRHIAAYYGGGDTGSDELAAVHIHGARAPAVQGLRVWFSAGLAADVAITGGFRTALSEVDAGQSVGGLRVRVGPGGLDLSDVVARGNDGRGIDVASVGDVLALRLTAEDNRGDGIRLLGQRRVDLGESLATRHAGYADLVIAGDDSSRVRGNRFTATLSTPLLRRDIVARVSPNLVEEVVTHNDLENAERGVHVLGGLLGNITTWPADHVYTVDGTVEVTTAGSLTLPAGSIVKFLATTGSPRIDADLIVRGTLVTDGTDGARVTLTSSADDTSGGDTNGDGNATAPAPGDWGAVLGAQTSNVTLRATTLAYGGGGDDGVSEPGTAGVATLWLTAPQPGTVDLVSVQRSQSGGAAIEALGGVAWGVTALRVDGCDGEGDRPGLDVQCGGGACGLTNVSVTGHGARGIHVTADGATTLTGVAAISNRGDGLTVDAGGRVALLGAELRNNAGFGLVLVDGAAQSDVQNAVVSGNTHLVRTHPRLVEQVHTNNVLEGDAIWVTSGVVDHRTTWRQDQPIIVVEGTVEVAGSGDVTLSPGTLMKFAPAGDVDGGSGGWIVRGRLNMTGSQSRQIEATSYRHDLGADTNRNGVATVPAAGDWAGIRVEDSGRLALQYAVIRYAGGSFETPGQPGDAAISIRGRVENFSVVTLRHSRSGGLTFAPQNPGNVRFSNFDVASVAPGYYGVHLVGGADSVELVDVSVQDSGHGIRTERDGYVSLTRATILRVHTCLSVSGPTVGDIFSIYISDADFGLVFHTCPTWRVHSGSYGPIRNTSPNPCQ